MRRNSSCTGPLRTFPVIALWLVVDVPTLVTKASLFLFQKVKWYKDVMILDESGRLLMETRGSRHSLIIRNVQPSDFGNYSCEADNKLGRSRKHIELSGRPNRAVFRSDPIGRMRDAFNVTWSVESYSVVEEFRLSYRKKHANETHDQPGQWHDVVIPSSEGSYYDQRTTLTRGLSPASKTHWKSYHIRNLEAGVMYEAKVVAKNKYGWAQQSDLFQFNTRTSDHYPYESSPQHDVIAGSLPTEVRDMRITSPTSFAVSVHSSVASVVISLLLPVSLVLFASRAATT
ncbi:Striated muscle-specific serine/threonine-protein kinase [Folsomia candida]|uniref:Striated muscle-specific serine/threonine-protein kinase n=1 Tax=Folsomia candida TaxID=158441 RepID=A0A226D129_FOLCA|nr:Striated muscle-specific serine/threonine-protein kinase [Folsomia candida]